MEGGMKRRWKWSVACAALGAVGCAVGEDPSLGVTSTDDTVVPDPAGELGTIDQTPRIDLRLPSDPLGWPSLGNTVPLPDGDQPTETPGDDVPTETPEEVPTSEGDGDGEVPHWFGDVPEPSEVPRCGDVPPPELPLPECTRTQGYWKTHPEAWPVSTLHLGGVAYDAAALLALLEDEVSTDASLILAHQLIAALLNGGAFDPAISAAIWDAQAWLVAHADADGLPFGTMPGSEGHVDASDLADELAAYNEGATGPGHCR
jgi:hypothetical protein